MRLDICTTVRYNDTKGRLRSSHLDSHNEAGKCCEITPRAPLCVSNRARRLFLFNLCRLKRSLSQVCLCSAFYFVGCHQNVPVKSKSPISITFGYRDDFTDTCIRCGETQMGETGTMVLTKLMLFNGVFLCHSGEKDASCVDVVLPFDVSSVFFS